MAFHLTKAEAKRFKEITSAIAAMFADANTAINAYNEASAPLRDALQEEIAALNEKLGDAREFAKDIVARAEDEIGEKSERWQKGEAASAAQEWANKWGEISLDDIGVEIPDDIEPIESDDIDAFGDLPVSVDDV